MRNGYVSVVAVVVVVAAVAIAVTVAYKPFQSLFGPFQHPFSPNGLGR